MKFKNICYYSNAGAVVNEDSLAFSDKYLIVMDGASGLYGTKYTTFGSDACWLSSRGIEEYGKRLIREDVPMAKLCLEAAVCIKKEYKELAPKDAPKKTCPSAGVISVRLVEETLEYYSVGDLTALFRYRDGSVNALHDNTVSELDRGVIAEMVRLARSKGETVAMQRPAILKLLQANREKKNTENGYCIFDPTAESADKGTSLLFDGKKIKSVALLSDGIADAVGVYGMAENYTDFFDMLETDGAAKTIDKLRNLQQSDPGFDRFPRFKMGDDATVLMADIDY